MEDKGKGKSLRKKKATTPKQISGPLSVGQTQAEGGLPRDDAGITAPDGGRPGIAHRERPGQSGKTSDLVKRRYSTRFTQLPPDFNGGAQPVPTMPSIPGQYVNKSASRDGRPSGLSDGQKIKVDMNAVCDPNLRPEQCMLLFQPNLARLTSHAQMLPHCSWTLPSRTYEIISKTFARPRTVLRPISNLTCTKTAPNS